jgi:SAM-dependent methyltransferase
MNSFQQFLNSIYDKDLSAKKSWYSAVAQAYDEARPRYPQELLDRVFCLAQLPANARILELGCGPGIATTAFAQRGMQIVAIEPSADACEIARRNCAAYPAVEIINSTFEEWPLEVTSFDAVVAASSFHWLSPAIRTSKAAEALKPSGRLILLWNVPPKPKEAVFRALEAVHEGYTPSLIDAISGTKHLENLDIFGREVQDSGLFEDVVFTHLIGEAEYSVDRYLRLLSTLSPYIALDAATREALFAALRSRLLEITGDRVSTSYLAAAHVARKKTVG